MLKRFFRDAQSVATSRHVTCLALVEAMQEPGCALCRLQRQKSQRYVASLLNTAVSDVEQRDAWRHAKGFCSWHASMATELPHSAGSLAILYDDVLNHEIKQLARVLTSRPALRRWIPYSGRRFVRRMRRWLQAWQQHRLCPACHLWHAQEPLYIAVLLDNWQEPKLAAAFAQSGGLCWAHTRRVAAQGMAHAHIQAFLEAQQARLQELQADLQEFIRKLDYRFAHHPYGSEADAWQRAMALFTSASGCPGNAGPTSPPEA